MADGGSQDRIGVGEAERVPAGSLAARYDVFLFDLDGVLYRGSIAVPGGPEAVTRLSAAGKRIAFVTNNSNATPEGVVDKLRKIGVDAHPEQVESSALATAHLLAERGIETVFVMGGRGVEQALHDVGITVLEGEPDRVDVVVVGFDPRVDYTRLRVASVLVDRGARLVATNADASFPAPDGDHWPGSGALLAAVETATGTTGEVVGKPNAPIFRDALARAGGGTPLMIGDRLDTDIAGAHGLGWDSLLVLTGVTHREDLAGADPGPTFVAEDLSVLFGPAPATS